MSAFEPLDFDFNALFDTLAEVRSVVSHLGSGLPDPEHREVINALVNQILVSEQAIRDETVPVFEEMKQVHADNFRRIEDAERDFQAIRAKRAQFIAELEDKISKMEAMAAPAPVTMESKPAAVEPPLPELSPPSVLVSILTALPLSKHGVKFPSGPVFPKTTGFIWQNWKAENRESTNVPSEDDWP